MLNILAQTSDQATEVVTTTSATTVHAWMDPAIAVALVFALAGTFFVSIFILRVRRKQASSADTTTS